MSLLGARDVFFPPIPIGVDFLGLGLPRGAIVGLAALAVSISVLVLLRRRKVHGCLAFIAAWMIFAAADCGAWVVNTNERTERRHRRFEERGREEAASAKAAEAGAPSASSSAAPATTPR